MSRLGTSVFLIGGVIAVALAAGLSLFFGSTPIPPDQVLGALFSPDMANQEHVAILELRGPRTVGCILVGAAFAVAGAIMQGVTRNPLADSGLLGINAGGAFALALCLALLPGMSFAGVVGCSFVGAAFALAVVFGAVSFRRRNVDPVLLVLAGCAVGLFLTALAQGVAIFFNIGYSLTFWTAGGVAGIRADTLAMTAPFIVAALAASWALARRVTVLSLGEEAASGLGVNVGASRTLCLLVVLVLAGAAVALAGPVAFVGLMVPHMVRRFVGSDYRAVIPASMVGGRCLCFWPMCSPARSWRRAKFPSASSSPSSACRSSSGARGGRRPALTERKRRLRTGATLAILAVLALLALWCDINAGYRSISLEELGQILSGTASQSLTYTLVDLRLPRVLTSLLVGVGLSLSGCLLQGVSRNDMADPGVLGINAGAGLLVAAFIVFVPAGIFPSAVALPLLAFAGSAAVAFLGWRLSVVRGASSPRRLLLIGVALATGLSSATSLLMLRMSDGDYAFVQNWLAGSIWGASWENVAILAVGLALLTAGAFYASRTLNVLGLGEAAATGLGVNVPRATAALTAVAVGASGLACAVGGGLTFVGLVCPHMARRLVGPNFRALVPACVLVGAVLMLLADIISRTLLAPNEIPVGIVAAVIGAPYFLYLLAKS